jgi:hypothetical protein
VAIDRERARQYLKSFDFRRLFLDQLGWDKHAGSLEKVIDGKTYRFQAVSEKRGVVALVSDSIPDYSTRAKLDKLVAKDHFEQLIVFADQPHGRQVWQWVRREPGKPNAIRAYTYSTVQSGELLLQKLEHLVVALEDEEQTRLADVLGRMRAGFDVEKVTKKFYERFKAEHDRFLKFVGGIPDKQMEAWYASVMINRLMFLYFIQAKSFLNGDLDYLRNKLKESRDRKKDGYYRDFLCPLFFEGFARKKEERTGAVNKLLGTVPYLNGGLFQRHQIEELHGKKIAIEDAAFEHLFSFFKEYDWHLDDREAREGNEINPDVLGYIFEKYINQKQMGAYYTKEDITEYISKNTIIPFLFDTARKDCAVAFDKTAGVWRLLRDDPDRYIYAALRHGTDLKLPTATAVGLSSVEKRTTWNVIAPSEYALPTELWREVVDRRRLFEGIRRKLSAGEVTEVNDLVTLNLDIRQFAQDVIQYCEGPELLRALYKAISKVSVLDPTCGSGAFLFAALNILKPLYEACLQRMQMFVDELEAGPEHHPKKFEDFRQILEESKRHPKQDYFILKSIIVNNLYGVDIMEEAVEICKLRLFLKLVAQVESQDRIEPLPDIDFNIRAGNTLVGYAHITDIRSGQGNLYLQEQLRLIEDRAKLLDSAVGMFRQQQTKLNGTVTSEDKAALRQRFGELESELNDLLAAEYGTKKADVKNWKASHKPFHWLSDFHRIMTGGGFDIVIGNPPWKEYAAVKKDYSVRNYATVACGNLHGITTERAVALATDKGRISFIVQLPLTSSSRMTSVRSVLRSGCAFISVIPFDDRPGKLFDGLEHCRSVVFTCQKSASGDASEFVSRYQRWPTEFRPNLFPLVGYASNGHRKLFADLFAKVGSSTATSIKKKLESSAKVLGVTFSPGVTKDFIFYQEATQYWTKATVGLPYYAKNGRVGPPAHGRYLYFDDAALAGSASAVLNSSLFYLYFIAFSDCFHLSDTLVTNFPVPGSLIADKVLVKLNVELMEDLARNAVKKTIETKDGDKISYAEFNASASKRIIDRIDAALARHYEFTAEELDFIINYDIKYRLGADADEE